MGTFHEAGLKHGTDKAVTHLYMDNYEKHLGSWRDKKFTLLELGVSTGASLRMWRELFPNAKVYGIDNNPDCAGEDVFIGSQTDKEFLDKVLDVIGIPDVIIDDCSHEGALTIETFEYLFPKLSEGGLYFIEDTATFYSEHYSPEMENGKSVVFLYFTGLAYDVDVAGRAMTGNPTVAIETTNPTFHPLPAYSKILESMHIYQSLWLFKRR